MQDITTAINNANGKNKAYHIKAKVKHQITEGIDNIGQRYSYHQIYLIPDGNSEFVKFFSNVNPFKDEMFEYVELVSIFEHPIGRAVRIEFSTPTSDCSENHFRIMTVLVNDLFKTHKEIETINFEIVPTDDEALYTV